MQSHSGPSARGGFSCFRLAGVAAALAVVAPAAAEAPALALASTQLEPMMVTATRSRGPDLPEAPAAVTVITREDIERGQYRSLAEALRGRPGISFTNTGGPGKSTSLFLRGTNSDHVRVMIDGVRVGSATTGQAAFENIPVGQIERIEIVRGPQSGLYGADAIGGVVQIHTRRGEGTQRSFFDVGGGSYGTFETAAGISGGGERGWYSLSTDYFKTDGFDARTLFEPDDDGYRQIAFSGRGGMRLGAFGELELHALRSEGESEFDGNPATDAVNESETVLQVLGGSWRQRWLDDALGLRLSIHRSDDRADNLRNGDFRTRFNTRRDEVQTQVDYRFAGQQFSLGVDYLDDQVEGTTDYAESSRDNTGVYLQWLGQLGAADLQLTGRYDDNEAFGSHETGRIGVGWRFSPELRARASYGTAFKAPTFNELYFPGFGNPDVQPEESRSAEAGLDWQAAAATLSLSAFHTTIDKLIDRLRQPDDSFVPENVDRARIEGIELAGSTEVLDWQFAAAYTWQRPRNRGDGSNAGNRLRRRPDQIMQFDVDRAVGRFSGGASLYFEGRRFEDAANNNRLGSYALVDLRATLAIAAAWSLNLRLANALDRDYETVPTYNQPGRAVYATLRYRL